MPRFKTSIHKFIQSPKYSYAHLQIISVRFRILKPLYIGSSYFSATIVFLYIKISKTYRKYLKITQNYVKGLKILVPIFNTFYFTPFQENLMREEHILCRCNYRCSYVEIKLCITRMTESCSAYLINVTSLRQLRFNFKDFIGSVLNIVLVFYLSFHGATSDCFTIVIIFNQTLRAN